MTHAHSVAAAHSAPLRTSGPRTWHHAADGTTFVSVTGWMTLTGDTLHGAALADRIALLANQGALIPELAQANGSYAIVLRTADELTAVVDHVRSIPLYEARAATPAFADHPNALQTHHTPRPQGAFELATGAYVLGPHTLDPRVDALQSGQLVTHKDGRRTEQQHHSYDCSYDGDSDLDRLSEHLHNHLHAAMARALATRTNERLLVPLSGGLDSRLILALLHESGASDIQTYTFGRPGNREARIAKEAAAEVGVPWQEIPYSGALWRRLWDDTRFRRFLTDTADGVSAAPVSEWPAVAWLHDEGFLDQGAIFLPGHTGDFLCGSHLKYLVDRQWNPDPTDLPGAIARKHLSLWDAPSPALDRMRRAAVSRTLPAAPRDASARCAAYERWEVQERQPKFILQTLRIYEWFGHDWRIPLWDRELLDFWRPIPLDLKVRKTLYSHYLRTRNPAGLFTDTPVAPAWQQAPEDQHRAEPPIRRRRPRINSIRKRLADYHRDVVGIARAAGFTNYVLREPHKRHWESLATRRMVRIMYDLDTDLILREAQSDPAPQPQRAHEAPA